jgi:hypothetical protein
MAASMKMTVLWDVAPCSLVDVSEMRTASITTTTHRPDDGFITFLIRMEIGIKL